MMKKPKDWFFQGSTSRFRFLERKQVEECL